LLVENSDLLVDGCRSSVKLLGIREKERRIIQLSIQMNPTEIHHTRARSRADNEREKERESERERESNLTLLVVSSNEGASTVFFTPNKRFIVALFSCTLWRLSSK